MQENEIEVYEINEEDDVVEVTVEETSIDQTEQIAAVDVDDVEIINVTISEAFPAVGEANESLNHQLLTNRDLADQHPIFAITGLRNELDYIESVKVVYSSDNGLAEFRKWDDGNTSGEDRSGYFVTIVPGTDNIKICDSFEEVYGVSVHYSGFVGNQNNLDKSDDYAYSTVGIVGTVRVRTDGTAKNGEYVIPNAYGIATFSENQYGYKVLSQGSYPSYDYVTIVVAPKTESLHGVLSESDELQNIIIQINKANENADTALENSQIAIDSSMSKEEIEDIINENIGNIESRLTDAEDVAKTAAENATAAKESAGLAQSVAQQAYTEALAAAKDANDNANESLAEVSSLKDDMTPIVEWSNGESSGVAGFVAQANEDHTLLASIVAENGPDGSDMSAIMQTADMIKHLVTHIDKYAVGEISLSYGLTYDEAKESLTDEYFYVPTYTHTETMSDVTVEFEKDYCYTWIPYDENDAGNTAVWVKSTDPISTATIYTDGTNVGDLWYCWQDVELTNDEGEVAETYIAGTLYRWFDGQWVAVATMADNHQGRVLSSVKQTSDGIKSAVNSSGAEGSTIEQKLNSIFTTVYDSEGYLSSIEQTAESIRAGTYTPDGTASQLELLTSENSAEINAVVSGRFHVIYQSYLGSAEEPSDGNKYTSKPQWNDELEEFVFADANLDNTNGTYYFIRDDKTKYCHVTDDGYEIWTIGNKATAGTNSRISETEAILTGTAKFDTENGSSLGNTTVQADEDGATVSSMAVNYYHSLVKILKEAPTVYGNYKYTKGPAWSIGNTKYEFDINNRSDDGVYYFIDENAQQYCKEVVAADGTVLYEIYALGKQSTASIVQKVTENSSSIGMVVENGEINASMIIEAMNDQSVASINADLINLNGHEISTNGDNGWKITEEYIGTKATGTYYYDPDTDYWSWGTSNEAMTTTSPQLFISPIGKESAVGYWKTNYILFAKGVFGVTVDGYLYASLGMIGSWRINNNNLCNKTYTTILDPNGTHQTVNGYSNHYVIYTNGNFGVTTDGYLYATGANISGHIDATTGTIGCFSIEDSALVYRSEDNKFVTLIHDGCLSMNYFENETNVYTGGIYSQTKAHVRDALGNASEITYNGSFLKGNKYTGISCGESSFYNFILFTTNEDYDAYHIRISTSTFTGTTAYTSDSDQNKKNTINVINDNYEIMFDSLIPRTFKYNSGTSNRLHIGFVAQELKLAIESSGLTTQDCAAYVEYQDIDGTDTCGIRYSEIIALNTHMIQKLQKRINDLEKELEELK